MKPYASLLILLFVFSGTNIRAQTPCIPDPGLTTPGIFPDSFANWSIGWHYWEEEIYFTFPTDTFLFGFMLPFDSIHFDSIANIPPGFPTFVPPPAQTPLAQVPAPNGLYQTCMYIDGYTPNNGYTFNPSFPNSDSITAYFTAYLHFDTIWSGSFLFERTYSFKWVPTVGVEDEVAYNPIRIYPNPVMDRSILKLDGPDATGESLTLMNLKGRIVEQWSSSALLDANREVVLDKRNYVSGIYFIRYEAEGELSTQKVLIR